MQIININNIITTQQLRIISHDSSKGENTPYYDITIFNTQQPFIHLHVIIQNYSQKICQVIGLKDHFQQSSSLILQL